MQEGESVKRHYFKKDRLTTFCKNMWNNFLGFFNRSLGVEQGTQGMFVEMPRQNLFPNTCFCSFVSLSMCSRIYWHLLPSSLSLIMPLDWFSLPSMTLFSFPLPPPPKKKPLNFRCHVMYYYFCIEIQTWKLTSKSERSLHHPKSEYFKNWYFLKMCWTQILVQFWLQKQNNSLLIVKKLQKVVKWWAQITPE